MVSIMAMGKILAVSALISLTILTHLPAGTKGPWCSGFKL